jgi:cell division transport system permease protein
MIKRFFRNIARHVKESWKNSWRNIGLTFSSVMAITITLVVTGFFLIIVANVNNVMEIVKSDLTILVEVVEIATDSKENLENAILSIDNVKEVSLSTKEEELQKMLEANEEFTAVFDRYKKRELLGQDIFLITLIDQAQVEDTILKIKEFTGLGDLFQSDTLLVEVNANITPEKRLEIQTALVELENVEAVLLSEKGIEIETIISEYDKHKSVVSIYREESNPLSDVFFVKVKDVSQISITAEQIAANPEAGQMYYGAGTVEKLVSIFTIIQQVGLVIIGALFVVTAFLVSNTIKITIYSRREEIEIMRLVGATKRFIRSPFILEGAIIGFFGAFFPIIITYFGYTEIYKIYTTGEGALISPFMQLLDPFPLLYSVMVFLAAVSLLVGILGSTLAVGKFLRSTK